MSDSQYPITIDKIDLPPDTLRCMTDRTRLILRCALSETWRFNHSQLGAEHILLGILKENASRAACLLKAAGVTLRKARLAIDSMLPGELDLPCTKRAFTEDASAAVQTAVSLAEGGHVTPEHLFGALLRPDGSAAIRVLVHVGMSPAALLTLQRSLGIA